MPTHRIRLVERVTEQGRADFTIEAPTPEDAVHVLSACYRQARDAGSAMIVLPDGRRQYIEPDATVATGATYILLDDAGDEVAVIHPPPDGDLGPG